MTYHYTIDYVNNTLGHLVVHYIITQMWAPNILQGCYVEKYQVYFVIWMVILYRYSCINFNVL